MGKEWKQCQTLFFWLQNHCRWLLQQLNLKKERKKERKTLAPLKESYDQPRQHIKKQRHYFASKGPSSQDYSFSTGHVWMWQLDCEESWVQKNWCFWTVVLEKTLEVPCTSRRSNQSILKEISPAYSLEALMLKLKLQYFSHLMWRTDSFERTLMLGKIEGRRRAWQKMRWLDGITNSMDMSLSQLQRWWWTGRPGMLQSMGLQRVGHDWATELSFFNSTEWQKSVNLWFIILTTSRFGWRIQKQVVLGVAGQSVSATTCDKI